MKIELKHKPDSRRLMDLKPCPFESHADESILSPPAGKVMIDEQTIMGIRDILTDLLDVQNGCPLPKYQEIFDRANASALQLIEQLGDKLKKG